MLRFRGDGPARDPREASYARMAEQFALARRVVSDYIEISDALEVQRQQMTNGR